jgi:hypothetical protein
MLERVYEPAIPELNIKEDQVRFRRRPAGAHGRPHRAQAGQRGAAQHHHPRPGGGFRRLSGGRAQGLINIYYAVVGRAELGASRELENWLKAIKKDHPSVGYYIKRRIVTDNLHGVDIMEEACEIAKLRLFLAMVSSVRKVEDLEPLPNIDFNILPGNSLVGLMRVDEHEFNRKQDDLFKPPTAPGGRERTATSTAYRHAADFNWAST